MENSAAKYYILKAAGVRYNATKKTDNRSNVNKFSIAALL